jgi:hypothetical protein
MTPEDYAAFRARKNAIWRAWYARDRRHAAFPNVECGPRRLLLLERLGLINREEFPDKDAMGVALNVLLDAVEHWITNTPEGARWAKEHAAVLRK